MEELVAETAHSGTIGGATKKIIRFFVICGFILSSCGGAGELVLPTELPPTPAPTSTQQPTSTPTPTAAPLVVQYWEDYSVSQLCLTLQETFGAAKTPDTPQPVRETLESLFSVMGIHVLPEGTQECPATLRLALSFTPLRAFYPGKGNCYTGVSMKGSMTISAPSKPSKSVEFNNRVNVSAHTRDCPNAEGAPFLGAWPTAVLDGLRRLWGAAALKAAFSVPLTRTALLPLLETISLKLYADELVPAYADLLADTDLDIARSAAIALEKFRSLAAPAVPQLTAALNTKDAQFFLWLGQALVSIGSAAAEAAPALLTALENADAQIRAIAAQTLGDLGVKRYAVLAALVAHTGDASASVSTSAIAALKKLTGKSYKTAQEWRDWWQKQPTPAP